MQHERGEQNISFLLKGTDAGRLRYFKELLGYEWDMNVVNYLGVIS